MEKENIRTSAGVYAYGLRLAVHEISASRTSSASAAVILWKGLLSQHPRITPHTRSETSRCTGRGGLPFWNTEKTTEASI